MGYFIATSILAISASLVCGGITAIGAVYGREPAHISNSSESITQVLLAQSNINNAAAKNNDLLEWSSDEIRLLKSLSLTQGSLRKRTQGNSYVSNKNAEALGHKLFFDKKLSANSQISCATCHIPDQYFSDGQPNGRGLGSLDRNTLTIVGAVYQTWMYWDGRRDSLWSQALVPLEAPKEMGNNRLSIARYLSAVYRQDYVDIFGYFPKLDFKLLPDGASPSGNTNQKDAWEALSSDQKKNINDIFVNAGRAIAAYESKVTPAAGRFDDFVDALSSNDREKAAESLNLSEQRGLKLFISNKTQCLNCHSSPMFSNYGFHNIGTSKSLDNRTDFGRMLGIHNVVLNEFNCDSDYASSANQDDCRHLKFGTHSNSNMLSGSFRVPGLRGLTRTAPYMHDGRFNNLAEVVRFYVEPQPQLLGVPNERPAAGPISEQDIADLVAFLTSLGGEIDVPAEWLRSPH